MSEPYLALYVEKRHPRWVPKEPNLGPHPPNRIREIRDALGVTQGQLARKLGLETAHLGKIENRHIKLHIKMMEQIARELAVTPGDLLEDTGRPLLSRREYKVLMTFRQMAEAEQSRFLRLLDAIEEPPATAPIKGARRRTPALKKANTG